MCSSSGTSSSSSQSSAFDSSNSGSESIDSGSVNDKPVEPKPPVPSDEVVELAPFTVVGERLSDEPSYHIDKFPVGYNPTGIVGLTYNNDTTSSSSIEEAKNAHTDFKNAKGTGDQKLSKAKNAQAISKAAYNKLKEGDRVGNYTVVKVYHQASGLDAYVLVNENTREAVLVFRGTEINSTCDLIADFKLATNKVSAQLEDAVRIANTFVSNYRGHGYDVLITGHSLGGYLANAAALYTNVQAITFDSPRISSSAITTYNLNTGQANNLITTYYVKGEFVSAAGYAETLGNVVYFDPSGTSAPISYSYSPSNPYNYGYQESQFVNSILYHGIDCIGQYLK